VHVVTATCVTCDVDAPGIGDSGYLGIPSLSTVVDEHTDPEDLPFGYLYEPLQAIGLRPRDLEVMNEFLRQHESHHVVAWSNAQDEDDWPPELSRLLSEREKRDEAAGGPRDGKGDVVNVAGQAPSDWTVGRYGVHCIDCRLTHRSEHIETLRSFDCLPLAAEAVKMMLTRWGGLAPDDGWNADLPPVVDPYGEFMEGLLVFLKQHRLHRVEARLDRVG
jgi:hypothetical protein